MVVVNTCKHAPLYETGLALCRSCKAGQNQRRHPAGTAAPRSDRLGKGETEEDAENALAGCASRCCACMNEIQECLSCGPRNRHLCLTLSGVPHTAAAAAVGRDPMELLREFQCLWLEHPGPMRKACSNARSLINKLGLCFLQCGVTHIFFSCHPFTVPPGYAQGFGGLQLHGHVSGAHCCHAVHYQTTLTACQRRCRSGGCFIAGGGGRLDAWTAGALGSGACASHGKRPCRHSARYSSALYLRFTAEAALWSIRDRSFRPWSHLSLDACSYAAWTLPVAPVLQTRMCAAQ